MQMPTWQESGHRHIALADGDLHVWIADLDETPKPAADSFLSADERLRTERFANRLAGVRWERSRATLRLLLGMYLGRDPSTLVFECGEHGKPGLVDDHPDNYACASPIGGAKLCFNLSHSGGTVLYAFARDVPVGIDVEQTRRGLDALALAKRAWGTNMADWLSSLHGAARERAFLRAWVRHEARVKCAGWGLSVGSARTLQAVPWVAELDVSSDAGAAGAAGALEAADRAWAVSAASPAEATGAAGATRTVGVVGMVGAVAAARKPARIHHMRWRVG